MSQQLFANNAGSTLAGAITNVSTIANLAAGTGALFPAPGAGQYFVGTFVDAATGLINEIVWVTSRTGDQITMTRAQENTTAKTWNSGDLFKMLVTAGALGQMLQTGQFPEQAFVHTGTDTGGSSNTIVATLTSAITQYDVGSVYRVKLLHDITGAATVNFNAVGAVALKRSDGNDTKSGDAYAGDVIDVSWNGTTAQLMSLAPPAATPEQAFVHTGTDTGGASNTIVATPLTPAITQYDVGAVYQIKLLNDITGASTVNFNAVGAVALKRSDGNDTQAGDAYAGNIIDVSWNGTTAQLMNRAPPTGQFFAPAVTDLVISVASNTTLSVAASRAVITNAGATKAQLGTGVAVTLNAATVGANGLDAGALAAGTWYYVWLIGNGTSVNSLLSLSSTAPTLPGGYTFLKYCGAVRTDGSAHFISSIQYGNAAQWVAPTVAASGTNGSLVGPSWVAVAVASFAPPNARRVRGFGHTNAGQFMIAPNNGYGAYTSTTRPPPCLSTPLGVESQPFDFVLETGNIYWASNDSGGANPTQLSILGWSDGSF